MAGPGGTEVGRISVRVVPDTSRLPADLRAVLEKIEATSKLNISVELDTGGLVEHAKAAVEEASAAAGAIHLDLDTDGLNEKAKAAVKEAQAAAGDIKVGVDIKGKGLQQAEQGISGLLVAVVTLGPALIPLGAALVAAFLPLVGILAAASLGIGGIVAVAIPQLQAIVKAGDDLSKLTPAQQATAQALISLKDAFKDFQTALAPDVLPLFTQGLTLLAGLLPALEPVVKNASDAFAGLLAQLGAFGSSKAGQQMLNFFTNQVGPAITTLGLVFGNVFAGIGGLLRGFGPLIKPIEASLIGATASFAKFGASAGTNKGFQNFLAYLQQVGPQVVAFLGAFGTALGHLVAALAPIGGAVLTGLTAVLNLFNKLPTTAVTVLAAAIIGVVAALGALSAIASVTAAAVTLYGAASKVVAAAQAVWTAAQWALNVALDANPIGLIVLAIAALVGVVILIATKTTFFQTVWAAVWGTIGAPVTAAVDFIKDHWKLILAILTGPIGAAVIFIISHWEQVKAATMAVWDAISGFVTSAWNKIKAAVSVGVDLVKDEIKGIEVVVSTVKDIFERVKTSISDKLGDAIDFVKSVPGKITGALGDLGSLLYNAGQNIIQGLIDGILSKLKAVADAASSVAGTIKDHFPNSPVKTGPLKVLNSAATNPGGQIVSMLAGGMLGNLGQARGASSALAGALAGGAVGGLAVGAVAGGNTITVNEARGEPTANAVLRAMAMAEALNFSPT